MARRESKHRIPKRRGGKKIGKRKREQNTVLIHIHIYERAGRCCSYKLFSWGTLVNGYRGGPPCLLAARHTARSDPAGGGATSSGHKKQLKREKNKKQNSNIYIYIIDTDTPLSYQARRFSFSLFRTTWRMGVFFVLSFLNTQPAKLLFSANDFAMGKRMPL